MDDEDYEQLKEQVYGYGYIVSFDSYQQYIHSLPKALGISINKGYYMIIMSIQLASKSNDPPLL